jgi:3-deoxy-D-manno-octulosonic-acid transferase
MPRWLYSLLLRFALPFAVLVFFWRGWRERIYRGSLRQRLAWSLQARGDRPLWLHAASVGEVRALAVLVRALHADSVPLVVTVGTPVGLARARELFADLPAVTVQAAPWDLPGAAQRFMRATRPSGAVFIETELWPNLISACRQAGAPLTLVSARLSARSLRRYQQLAADMMRDAVRAFGSIAAQSPIDRDRFIALGADPARVTVCGNLKFDLQLPADIHAQGTHLRNRWAAGRSMWVAGSTHPEEEAICVDAHRALLTHMRRAGQPPPLLVLAPRRPERFAAVARWLATMDLKSARRSTDVEENADVLLLDVMGELLCWYAAGDVAYVGGSLVPIGGHNLLEPAALAKPVIAGPHCFNSPDCVALLSAAGALTTVENAAQLTRALEELLRDTALAHAHGVRAAEVVAANRGAATRALAAIAATQRAATAPA